MMRLYPGAQYQRSPRASVSSDGHARSMVVHGLRHGLASYMTADGSLSDQAIADYLGHTTPRLLIERYGHALAGSGRLVTERMGAVVR